MRRRPIEHPPGLIPPALAHYDPNDWPDAECHPECAYWNSYWAWRDVNPDVMMDGDEPGPDLPWHLEEI